MFIDEEYQILSVERADVEQQSRTLSGPEAHGDVFSRQRGLRLQGRGQDGRFSLLQLTGLLEDVGDGCRRLKVGRNL